MRSCARSPITIILALLGTLLSGSFALAEDYSVDFGADTVRGRDAGTLQCDFGQICRAKMESLDLTIKLDIVRSNPLRAHIRLDGGNLDCCYYFGGAASSIDVDPYKPTSRIPFFKGPQARGGLFIENERVGFLYLRFRFF